MKLRKFMKRLSFVMIVMAWLAQGNAISAEFSKQDICRIVATRKESAVLLTEDGDTPVKAIQLGDFDFSDKSKWDDFIPSTKKFKLILKPANIVLEEDCSLATCIEKVETRPRCPNTREYIVSFQLNPRKFGPGPFDAEIDLRLLNKKEQRPVEDSFKFNFEKKISGTFYMPSAEIIQRPENMNSVIQFLKGGVGKIDLEVSNKGNKPLRLGKWDQLEQIGGVLALDAAGCQDLSLPPGGACMISLRNPSKSPVTEKYLHWFNHFYKGDINISLYLTPRRDGSVDYNIKND